MNGLLFALDLTIPWVSSYWMKKYEQLHLWIVSSRIWLTAYLAKNENCDKGKLVRLPFSNCKSVSKEILELMHSDVVGPMETRRNSWYWQDKRRFFSKSLYVYDTSKAMVENQTESNVSLNYLSKTKRAPPTHHNQMVEQSVWIEPSLKKPSFSYIHVYTWNDARGKISQ